MAPDDLTPAHVDEAPARDPGGHLQGADAPPPSPAGGLDAQLQVIEPPAQGLMHAEDTPVGAMWPVPDYDVEGRAAWAVMLPNGAGVWWTTQPRPGGDQLYDVHGDPPAITVDQEIDVPGRWKGRITDGRFVS